VVTVPDMLPGLQYPLIDTVEPDEFKALAGTQRLAVPQQTLSCGPAGRGNLKPQHAGILPVLCASAATVRPSIEEASARGRDPVPPALLTAQRWAARLAELTHPLPQPLPARPCGPRDGLRCRRGAAASQAKAGTPLVAEWGLSRAVMGTPHEPPVLGLLQ
jgi:hypothetical protein